jgi:hypothetical protein
MIRPPTEGLRVVALDSWRGICALLVAAFHLQALAHIYDLPIVRHAFLFVDFFFVLSGFIITHAYADRIKSGADLRSFLIRRFGRIWPLQTAVLIAFIAAEALNLLLAIVIGLKTGRPPFDPEGFRPLSAIPVHFLLLQALNVTDRLTWNFPSWSISAEFWTYIVFAAVCLAYPLRKTAALVALGLVGALMVAAFSTNGIEVTYDLGFFRCVYGFAVGHLVYRLYRGGYRIPQDYATAAELLALTAAGAFVWFVSYGAASLLAPIVFGFTVFVFSLERGPLSRLLKTRPFERLGDLSYSIYIVHAFVVAMIWVAVTVLQRFAGRSQFAEIVDRGGTSRVIANLDPFLLDGLFVAYLLATVGLATLTYRYIEGPGRRAFAGWPIRWTTAIRAVRLQAVRPRPKRLPRRDECGADRADRLVAVGGRRCRRRRSRGCGFDRRSGAALLGRGGWLLGRRRQRHFLRALLGDDDVALGALVVDRLQRVGPGLAGRLARTGRVELLPVFEGIR